MFLQEKKCRDYIQWNVTGSKQRVLFLVWIGLGVCVCVCGDDVTLRRTLQPTIVESFVEKAGLAGLAGFTRAGGHHRLATFGLATASRWKSTREFLYLVHGIGLDDDHHPKRHHHTEDKHWDGLV